MLHSSIWPTLLFSDSSQSNNAGAAVATLSYLSTLGIVLVAIVSVILPLGLAPGPLLPTQSQVRVSANYVTDTSPLSLAATAGLEGFIHGRLCHRKKTDIGVVPCPGQEDAYNFTYPSTLIDIFNSTRHSPFTMQYRRAYRPYVQLNITSGILSTPQSLLLRDNAFIVEGLVVDMSVDKFGIGFWNHTLPETPNGGVWSQDILWLEPVTECVDTNLTVDYVQTNSVDPTGRTASNATDGRVGFNITDHGGFHSPPHDIPPPLQVNPIQRVDLTNRAFRGAVLNNLHIMRLLNATRESSFEGKGYRLGFSEYISNTNMSLEFAGLEILIGQTSALPSYSNNIPPFHCNGYDPLLDNTISTNVMVACGGFLGPPLRSDGGDPRIHDVGSLWHQRLHVCASATRVSIHEVTFSVNNSKTTQDVQVTHRLSRNSVLWGVENTSTNILSINPLWGRLDDKYEGHPDHLWIVRDEYLYLPTGASEGWPYFRAGEPLIAPNVIWEVVYSYISMGWGNGLIDYSGISDYAVQMKLSSFVDSDPTTGYAHIRNVIWTDIMANSVVGSATNHTLMISPFQPTLEYDFRFAIPASFLLMVWVPTFLASLFLLATRTVRFTYMKQILNHTSVGRVVVGTASLQVEGKETGTRLGHVLSSDLDHLISPHRPSMDGEAREGDEASGDCKKSWASRFGATLVSLTVDRYQDKPTVSGNPKSSP